MASVNPSRHKDLTSYHLSELLRRICQPEPPTGFDHHFHPMADLASCVAPLLRRETSGTGILNLLSITYAFRPRLRYRLTLGGRTFPRNPWDFGGRDSRPAFRYSCPHNHFHAVHRSSRYYFKPHGTLLYRFARERAKPAASAAGFSPDYSRRKITRRVSYYALFK